MLTEPGKNKAGEESSEIEFTPELISAVQRTVQTNLKKYNKHSQESAEVVVGNVITRLVKWVRKQIGSDSVNVDNESLIKIGVRTSQNESKRFARAEAGIQTVSLNDFSETLAPTDIKTNIESETAAVAFKWWRLIKKASFRQRIAILFDIEQDDFLLLLLKCELVPLDNLATIMQTNEDELILLLKSLPWKDPEIAAYIASREKKICTAKNVVDARYAGRKKLLELELEENRRG